jgi:hypothetical protein
MNPRQEFAINTLLLVTIAALVVYLVRDVREVRETLTTDQRKFEEYRHSLDETQETSFGTSLYAEVLFGETDIFNPIVTPIPTNTPVPIPTATPAPPPFCENWQVLMILGKVVQIKDYLGNSHYIKEGGTLENIQIIEVNQAEDYIVVKNPEDGRTKRLRRIEQR